VPEKPCSMLMRGRSRAAMDRVPGLWVGGDYFVRWPSHYLEHFYFANMGVPDQHLHSDR